MIPMITPTLVQCLMKEYARKFRQLRNIFRKHLKLNQFGKATNGKQINTQAVGTQYKTRNGRNISQITDSSSHINYYMYSRHTDTTHGINIIKQHMGLMAHGKDGTHNGRYTQLK